MALAGNIKEFGLADIFQIVSLQQKTGSLSVKGKEGTVTILLEKGLIVGADASFRSIEERLQRTLAHSAAISKFQLQRALETQKKTSQPLWTVLAETKSIDFQALQGMLSQQIHETVYHVLRWSEGEYRFEPQKNVVYDRQLTKPINTEFLVMEGFRITDEWAYVEKVITSFQLEVRRKSGSPDTPDGLSDAESKIYTLLTEERSVQDLIDMGQIGEFDTCQITYELIQKGLVERIPGTVKKGKAPDAARRSSVAATDLLVKIASVVLGISILGALVFGLRYIPEDFTLIHRPTIQGTGPIKRLTAQSQISNLTALTHRYFLDYNKFPESFEEMKQAGLIRSARILTDPWGSPYRLERQGNQLIISSSGTNEENAPLLQRTVSF
ncbi:MAG: DUF4388 domain-containing protein [bacterium]|nr:DUF4388 domain-containing protein [bacterium]